MISNTYKVKISGPLWREETVNIDRHREDSGGETYAYISNAKDKKKKKLTDGEFHQRCEL